MTLLKFKHTLITCVMTFATGFLGAKAIADSPVYFLLMAYPLSVAIDNIQELRHRVL